MKWLSKLRGLLGAPREQVTAATTPEADEPRGLESGDPVTAPDPRDPLSGGQLRVPATFVEKVRLAPPQTLGGPRLEPNLLCRVRYADGTEQDWTPELVLPAEATGNEPEREPSNPESAQPSD